MIFKRQFIYTASLIWTLLFCAPLSMQGQVVVRILTTQRSKTLRDGSQYKGDMMLMRPHGRGKMTYADGSVYQGYFERGKRHG